MSRSHDEAFRDLLDDEKTALDVLEHLYAETNDEDEKQAINRVEAMIMR